MGSINVINWPEVNEAIEDDLPTRPEEEFTTNAIGHLEQKNFRLALLESIIGLEIVLTGYLKEYLRVHKGFDARRIGDFVNRDLGLTARLQGLLDFTLHPDDLQSIDRTKLKKAVEWRNKITHSTGHLPEQRPPEEIRSAIHEVIKLTQLLGRLTDLVSVHPQISKISDQISSKYNLARPSISRFGKHGFLVRFNLFGTWDGAQKVFPSLDELQAAVEELIQLLSELDPRFRAEEADLFVDFREFPDRKIAWWFRGQMKKPKREPLR